MLVYENFRDIPHPLRLSKRSRCEKQAALFAAFPADDVLTFTVSVDRAFMAENVRLRFRSDESGHISEFSAHHTMPADGGRDVFSAAIDLSGLWNGPDSGLYYYHVVCDTLYGTLYSHGKDTEEDAWFSDREDYADPYQLLLYAPDFRTPEFLRRGVMYQIFVDRFCRGGDEAPRPDAEMAPSWDAEISQYPAYPGAPLKNNLFYGGDLDGVRLRLPYLRSLGVTVLYLCPIFEAYSNHKYDTGDYRRVDAMFGGDAALSRLLAAAEKAGVRVLLDGVFNHTGAISRYFNADGRYDSVGAAQSPESPYYGWYHFDHYPDRYRCWWGVTILPTVDSSNPDYIRFIAGKGGVVDTYLQKGVSGFRLDVADELNEHLLRQLRCTAKAADPEAAVIGEVWEDASNKVAYDRRRHYFTGGELDSVMNYPLKNAIISYLMNGEAETFSTVTRTLYAHYPRPVSEVLMNLLGTHDTERILTVLSGRPLDGLSYAELRDVRLTAEEYALAKERLKLAWLLLACMPGIPCIYYGDEAGMEGAKDPFNRRTYPWGREDGELLAFYRRVGSALREGYAELLAHGYYRVMEAKGDRLVICRFGEEGTLFLAVNRGTGNDTVILPDGHYTDVWQGAKTDATLSLAPRSFRLLYHGKTPG